MSYQRGSLDFTAKVINWSTLTPNLVKRLCLGEVQGRCSGGAAWGLQPEEEKLVIL